MPGREGGRDLWTETKPTGVFVTGPKHLEGRDCF